jgi:hypothetical protein
LLQRRGEATERLEALIEDRRPERELADAA